MSDTEHTAPDRLAHTFALQRNLQESVLGYSFDSMTTEQRIEYIRTMILALTDELHEALHETSWKPWAQVAPYIREQDFRNELVDAWHFLLNLCLVAGMTPDDLYYGYVKKRNINVKRQRTGYDGVSTKCNGCQRALEDVGVDTMHDDTSMRTIHACGSCHASVSSETAQLLANLSN